MRTSKFDFSTPKIHTTLANAKRHFGNALRILPAHFTSFSRYFHVENERTTNNDNGICMFYCFLSPSRPDAGTIFVFARSNKWFCLVVLGLFKINISSCNNNKYLTLYYAKCLRKRTVNTARTLKTGEGLTNWEQHCVHLFFVAVAECQWNFCFCACFYMLRNNEWLCQCLDFLWFFIVLVTATT